MATKYKAERYTVIYTRRQSKTAVVKAEDMDSFIEQKLSEGYEVGYTEFHPLTKIETEKKAS